MPRVGGKRKKTRTHDKEITQKELPANVPRCKLIK